MTGAVAALSLAVKNLHGLYYDRQNIEYGQLLNIVKSSAAHADFALLFEETRRRLVVRPT